MPKYFIGERRIDDPSDSSCSESSIEINTEFDLDIDNDNNDMNNLENDMNNLENDMNNLENDIDNIQQNDYLPDSSILSLLLINSYNMATTFKKYMNLFTTTNDSRNNHNDNLDDNPENNPDNNPDINTEDKMSFKKKSLLTALWCHLFMLTDPESIYYSPVFEKGYMDKKIKLDIDEINNSTSR